MRYEMDDQLGSFAGSGRRSRARRAAVEAGHIQGARQGSNEARTCEKGGQEGGCKKQ